MYLLRLDDASAYWDRQKWLRMAKLLNKYDIKPIFAVIPYNEDPFLLKYGKDELFWETIEEWINNGWTPALHGYNHVMNIPNAGINPVNNRSEFAGLGYDKQKEKIEKGKKILKDRGIFPKVFVAPGHTFDRNTLKVLKETEIKVVSDTIANDVYKKNGLWFIPQQSGVVRKIKFKTVTFCYHPNTMKDKDFSILEEFLKENKKQFTTFENLELKERRFSLYDFILQKGYFLRHKMAVKKWKKKQGKN